MCYCAIAETRESRKHYSKMAENDKYFMMISALDKLSVIAYYINKQLYVNSHK